METKKPNFIMPEHLASKDDSPIILDQTYFCYNIFRVRQFISSA